MNSIPSQDNDLSLLLQIKEGDAYAFEQLYTANWKYVFNCAYKRTQDVEISKDICQDIFSQLWHQICTKDRITITNVKGYLYNAVRNHVLKWLEISQKSITLNEALSVLEDKVNNPEIAFLYEELVTTYGYITNALPAQQQLIFRLKYDEGLDNAAIAAQLNISEKTVRNQIARALHKLKSQLLIHSVLVLLYLNS